METYSSNIDNSIFQDLGPFKVVDADDSVKGKTIYSYTSTNVITEFGQKQEFGEKHVIGNSYPSRSQ